MKKAETRYPTDVEQQEWGPTARTFMIIREAQAWSAWCTGKLNAGGGGYP